MAPIRFSKKHVPRRRGDEVALEPGKSISQTVKRDGQRMVINQRMKADGEVVTKITIAHTLEADIQAAQVSALKAHPDYEKRFLLAGDQNAAKRGPVASMEAKRTGMAPGEPDLRLYVLGDDGEAYILLIENKNGGGSLSQEQKDRHMLLERLGFNVWTIKTDDKDRAAKCAIALLDLYLRRSWVGWQKEYPEISRYFLSVT